MLQTAAVLLILLIIGLAKGYTISHVQRLKKELFTDSGYDRHTRPILNQSTPMQVTSLRGFFHLQKRIFLYLILLSRTSRDSSLYVLTFFFN